MGICMITTSPICRHNTCPWPYGPYQHPLNRFSQNMVTNVHPTLIVHSNTPHYGIILANLLDECCFHLNCNNQLIHWMENLFTYVMSTNFSPNSFRHITWTTGYSKRWTVWLINTLKVMQHNFLMLFMRQLTFIIFPLVNNTWHSITVVKSCNSDLIFECNH